MIALVILAVMVLGLATQCLLLQKQVDALSLLVRAQGEAMNSQSDAIAALIRGNNSIITHLQARDAEWARPAGKEWRS